MLYLRTGGNGSGKTLLTLKDVRELQLKTGRPVCINIRPADDPRKPNQPYCNIKPEILEEFGWKKIRFEEWEAQEDGTIFLIDECHYDFPKRSGSGLPPRHIAALTEHRSRGFDFFLLTQHPRNIDVFVRNLVQAPGWHEHIKRLGGALPVAQFHQWDAVKLDCERFGSAKDAQTKTRPYPREVYTWYDSATIHTGKKRIPWQVWFILAAPALIVFLFWRGFSGVGAGGKQADKTAAGPVASSGTGYAPASGGASAGPKTTHEFLAMHRPRIEGLRHTAPAYDELTRPMRVPVPAACISMGDKCKCYTQDATSYTTTDAICRQIVQNGLWLDFNPAGAQGTVQPAAAPARPASPVAGYVGEPAVSGVTVIPDLSRTKTTEAKVTAVEGEAQQPQARVSKSSPWSFQTGGH